MKSVSYSNKILVETVCAKDLKIKPILWFWNGWIAAGKMHILGGAPGTGKTTICMHFAAVVSRGGHWPDGSESIIGDVLIWSGEDDPQDTLMPRLIQSGADLSRIHFVTGVSEGKKRRSFDPACDLDGLKRKIQEIGHVVLVVIDPIASAVSGDSHKNNEVRRGLQTIVDLAADMNFALIGVTHFSKGNAGRDPKERIIGSVAFVALARLVFVTAKSENNTHILVRAKSNLGTDSDGFKYELQEKIIDDYPDISTASLIWGDKIEGSARELLAIMEAPIRNKALENAKIFLTDLLTDDPVPQIMVKEECKTANISWATARRAQKELGIISKKDGLGAWHWALSSSEDAQNN